MVDRIERKEGAQHAACIYQSMMILSRIQIINMVALPQADARRALTTYHRVCTQSIDTAMYQRAIDVAS